MKIIYQADDGRQFDAKDECEAYEREKLVYSHIHAVDDAGKVLNPEDSTFIDYAIVVTLETEEAVAEFIHKGKEEASNVLGVTKPGTYVWNFVDSEWQTEHDFLDYWAKFIADAKLAFEV